MGLYVTYATRAVKHGLISCIIGVVKKIRLPSTIDIPVRVVVQTKEIGSQPTR